MKRLMMAGDSNTQSVTHLNGVAAASGWSLVGTQTAGWVWKGKTLANGYRSPPHEGYGGKGVAYLSKLIARAIKACRPDVCLLNIGANDMWYSLAVRVPITIPQARKVVAAWCGLADSIEKLGVRVVAVMPITPRNSLTPLAVLRAGILNWAKGRGRPAVDAAGCANDGVHFSDAGFALLSKREGAAVKGMAVGAEPEEPRHDHD